MSLFLNAIRYTALLALTILLAALLGEPIWNLYTSIYPESGGSWIDLHAVAALMLSYVFFLPLIFTMLGGQRKVWLIAVFYSPIIFFELTNNFYSLFMFTGIGLAGFFSGWLARYIVTHTLGKMPRFEPLKKYF